MKKKTNITAAIIFGLLFTVFAFSVNVPAQTDTKKDGPVVEGNAPVIPAEDEVTKKWEEQKLQSIKKGVPLTAAGPKRGTAGPKARKRGNDVDACGVGGFSGKCKIYQFVNPDMPDKDKNCGTAAMATALWNIGLSDPSVFSNNKEYFAREVYRIAPPKITLAGWVPINSTVGMDWRQFNSGLDAFKNFGVKYYWFNGEAELQKYLDMKLPVALMLDMGALPSGYPDRFGGHWVIAFGHDATYYYLSNFNGKDGWYKLRKSDLRDAWGASSNPFVGILAKGHGTGGKGVVIWR